MEQATSIGVFVNSLAGTLAYSELGPHLTPTDILNKIQDVLNNPLEAFKKKAYKKLLIRIS